MIATGLVKERYLSKVGIFTPHDLDTPHGLVDRLTTTYSLILYYISGGDSSINLTLMSDFVIIYPIHC